MVSFEVSKSQYGRGFRTVNLKMIGAFIFGEGEKRRLAFLLHSRKLDSHTLGLLII